MKQRCQRAWILWVALVCWTVGLAGNSFAASKPDDVTALINRTTPAFVFLLGGSGVVISPDGLVLSNAHVIEGGREFTVRLGDGRSFKAKLVGYHGFGDLALLQIEGGKDLPYVKLGDSDEVRVGDWCMAIGNPLALGMLDQTPAVSAGVISATQHVHRNYADSLVTDAPINPGNSGGPLINARGELIGINGQIRSRMGLRSNTGLGFAIPANRIKLWLPVLKKANGKEVAHGRMDGIEWENEGVKAQLGFVTPTIRKVTPGSDAERAGFRDGDKVQKCQGKDIRTSVQLLLILAMQPAAEPKVVVVEREGQQQTLMFKLDPASTRD